MILRLALLLTVALCVGCRSESASPSPGQGRGGGGPRPARDQPEAGAAVPVETRTVERRRIASYIETNGTLEAENEVDVVARMAGPIVELLAEEGDRVVEGRPLARLERDSIAADLEIARVALQEAELSFQRARKLESEQLISREEYERARSAYESAQAQFDGARIRYEQTEILAPFGGLVTDRFVDRGQYVAVGQAVFRVSDFTPLLCRVQVPERELARLRAGQAAYLLVEAWPGERFPAAVLRVSPVVDGETGTIRVTLRVEAKNRLRPGMFSRVFLETEVRDDALVIPKSALSLESLGDTVYVARDGRAERREVRLGFRQGDDVEVLAGLEPGEEVVVVGQDGLSQDTPLRVLRRDGARTEAIDVPAGERGERRGPRGNDS